jgi:hypothetical protein
MASPLSLPGVGLLLMASLLSLPGVPPQHILLAVPCPLTSRTPVPAFFFFEGVHCLLLSVLFYNFLLFSGMNGVRNIKVKISTSYLICCCNNPKSRIEFTVKKYNLFD